MLFLSATIAAILVAGVHSQSPDINPNNNLPRGVIEDRINATIEQFRQALKNGVPEMGIPSFDPLLIERWMYDTGLENIITIYGSFRRLLIEGLTDFQTTHIKFDLFKLLLSLEIVIPEIVLTSQYNVNGTLVNFIPVHGEGNLGVYVGNVLLNFDMQLQIFPALRVKYLTLLPDFEVLKFQLTGLMNNEDFSKSLENTLNEHVGPAIKQNKKVISEIISNYLKELINGYLPNIKLDELLNSNNLV